MVDFARVITVRERKVGAAKSRESAAFRACQAARLRLTVARQEMEHLGFVCNMLSAIGGLVIGWMMRMRSRGNRD